MISVAGKILLLHYKKINDLSEHMRSATNNRSPRMYYEEHKACKIQSPLSLEFYSTRI